MVSDYYFWGAQDLSTTRQNNRFFKPRTLIVQPGILLEDAETGWAGVVVSLETIGGMRMVGLEDFRGKVKSFPLGYGFLYEGEAVKVVAPTKHSKSTAKRISRSGSRVVEDARARVARASRLWVEGLHDAELVEKVWGHDLRVEGIVVEALHGIDDLADAVARFEPSAHRKLGILVDHLVTGSKEFSIAEQALTLPGAKGNVLVVGHPYIDVWQAVKPQTLGIQSWPRVPFGEDWKRGILKRLGWAYDSQQDIAAGWQRILNAVDSYFDLEPSILGPVEQLIDFLTLTD